MLGTGFLFVREQAIGTTSLEVARTVAVNALVMGQIFYLLNTRFFTRSALSWEGLFGNKVVLLVITVCLFFQFIFIYTPFMNTLFATAPLDLGGWLRSVSVGLALFILVEIEKFILEYRARAKLKGV